MKVWVGQFYQDIRTQDIQQLVEITEDRAYLSNPYGAVHSVAYSTLHRWWRVYKTDADLNFLIPRFVGSPILKSLDPDKQGVVYQVPEMILNTKAASERQKAKLDSIGSTMYKTFIRYCKKYNVDIIEKNSGIVYVKYRNFNVFELRRSRHRLTVLCHEKSLVPDNYRRAVILPKSYQKALRAKFQFFQQNQHFLMESIVADGIFYRSEFKNQ